jgi:hypothetical protein
LLLIQVNWCCSTFDWPALSSNRRSFARVAAWEIESDSDEQGVVLTKALS